MMNSYLIPNKAFLKLKQKRIQFEGGFDEPKQIQHLAGGAHGAYPGVGGGYQGDGEFVSGEEEDESIKLAADNVAELDNMIKFLEADTKKLMETNWKLLHKIEEACEERNFYFDILRQIEVCHSVNMLII
jgi:hypothetical protein